jgi:signal transduction histidine kinase
MRPLSFRYRVPLDVSLVVLVTGLSIAGIVLWHDYHRLRADAEANSDRLGRLLAHALLPDLRVDETWHAYQTLMSVYRGAEPSWLLPSFALVLDADGRTWVASDPPLFPMAQKPEWLAADEPLLTRSLADPSARMSREVPGVHWIYRLMPVTAGDAAVGTLVLAYSKDALGARFHETALRVLIATGALLFLLLPFGWWVGRRIARPLVEIEGCVARLGDRADLPLVCPTQEPYDELGRLRARIEAVAAELEQKQALERQMIRSERQAALGRLAAGVAHEINNPLGGMLTAIGMYRRHGGDPVVARQTLSLLERGLDQIRHVVSALLVEVKEAPRELTPKDIDDIAELVAPRVRETHLHLIWENRLARPLALPAGPVRQILLNLALNAAQATPAGEAMAVLVEAEAGALRMRVTNAGVPIPEARLDRLFEPFAESSSGGSGLGLWMTDQTVRQLGGRIHADSRPGQTTFEVTIPVGGEV